MRLFFSVLMVTLLLPALCFAEPLITDDIVNQPTIVQPEGSLKDTVEDSLRDSVEVPMPATPVDGMPVYNATLSDVNATLPNANATLPIHNATLPGTHANLPNINATLPNANATLQNANATLPNANATLPNANATLPNINATRPLLPVQVTVQSPEVPIITPTTPTKAISVADFLVKAAEKAPEPIKPNIAEPVKPEPKKQEPQKAEPKKTEPVKPEPQKPAPKKPEPGQGLKIPPDAAKTGDVSFLQGCWRGQRPEYSSKRMVTERFCFDDSGVGKRTIQDPTYAGNCYGATRALLNKDGVLHMKSEQAVCTSGEIWGPSEMICRGEGEQTPCFWNFTAVGGNANQSYKISFVRE